MFRRIASIVLLAGWATVASAQHSLHFDGKGQIMVVPYQRVMDVKEVTLEAWFRFEDNEQYFNYLLFRNYGDMGYGIAFHGLPKMFSQAPATKVPTNAWTHVALALSEKALKCYVNGELAYAEERNGPLEPFEHALMIGNSDFLGGKGGTSGFPGAVDEVRIWSYARTQDQIKQTMNRYLRGNEKGLLGYFPFEEGKGQIAHDYSGHLISGSLGRGYTPEDIDPTWVEGVKLSGPKPKIRVRRNKG